MKENTNEKSDNIAAIGIGAMIVFIALILVAAVAAAVIIQTAEKLQQNAQASGDDTQEQMSTKVTLINIIINTCSGSILSPTAQACERIRFCCNSFKFVLSIVFDESAPKPVFIP